MGMKKMEFENDLPCNRLVIIGLIYSLYAKLKTIIDRIIIIIFFEEKSIFVIFCFYIYICF